MYYPLRFKPLFQSTVWGGRSLADLGKELPYHANIAESWEISAHPKGVSVIANGEMSGIPLAEACRTLGNKLLGSRVTDPTRFPFLIKFIDAHSSLSIQVHPDDDYAFEHENGESGKSELWYVLSAKPDSTLIAGLKPKTTRQQLTQALKDGSCLDLMQIISVKPGDVINIPPGFVHAIGSGVILYEIQQSSDLTYRLYDYDRLDQDGQPRQLNIKKALDVIRFDQDPVSLISGLVFEEGELIRRHLALNRYFWVEEMTIQGTHTFCHDGSRFSALTAFAGDGYLTYTLEAGHQIREPIFRGDSLLIPAAVSEWSISGDLKFIVARPSFFHSDLADLNRRIEESGLSAKYCPPELTRSITCIESAARNAFIALEPRA